MKYMYSKAKHFVEKIRCKNNEKNSYNYIKEIISGTILLGITLTLLCGCSIAANYKENEIQKEEEKNETELQENQRDLVQEKVKSMTLEERVGQLFIVGFNGTEANEEITNMIKVRKVGGVIFFGGNLGTVAESKELIEDLNNLNSENHVKLFMSLDEEGGIVSRIPKEMGSFESAWNVGSKGDLKYAFDHGMAIGETIKSLGFNLNFAPVLDVNSNPNNPVIGSRAFSDNPEVVKTIGTEVFKGMKSTGIIASGKHFPGHGDTSVDSHFTTPIINKSIEELRNLELIPFKYAIDEGIDMIMVGHLYLPQLDSEYISSLSSKIITGLLRQELGFNGVVITDDMMMEGVKGKYSTKEAAVKAIQAGNDIMIMSRTFQDQGDAIDGVMEAIKNGIISEERINESVYRIIKLKNLNGQ
ncbi:MAG: glycoside hydrolase family 3 N-terminal domain-containing protein [Clostridium sp.]|uniref:glycoside hydrolase family 3 N-terminal domain-containing protein n=1 Tax=Clostridium sp. TaxID=1506 RepID=UPI00304D100F